MPAIGLAEAARLTGKNQSTIHRAMKTGRLSFTVNDTGERKIDVGELQRVFPIKRQSNGATDAEPLQSHSTQVSEIATLQARIAEQARMLAAQSDVIRDYQQRLDTSEAERRRVQERLTALLTHRSTASVPAVQPAAVRAPWWRRWFR